MTTFIFPGQGSQKKGMGEGLFDEFRDLTAQADDILGYSIKKLCLEDPGQQLNLTQYTQPALYVVNALTYFKKIKQTAKRPNYVAGHSLGEYNALLAAGVFDFATGLKLVRKRGEVIGQATGGGMAAVIGLNEERLIEVLAENNLASIDVANYNSPAQIVISGPRGDIEKAQKIFEAAGAKLYVVLKVSGAFHSRYMQAAKDAYEKFLTGFEFGTLGIPVISNVSARPYQATEIKANLVNQITSAVKWTETIRYLWGKGETEYEEIGVGTVLTGLVKQIQKEAKPLIVDEPVMPAKVVNELPAKSAITAAVIRAEDLGSAEFKKDYQVRYAYATGGMYKGIASKEMIVKIGKAGMIGFLGTGGLSIEKIEEAIKQVQKELVQGEAYGVNLLCNLVNPQLEEETIDLFLKYGIKNVEAAAYMQITPALVRYRLQGLSSANRPKHKIIAKVSRPEIAQLFLSPAPERIVEKLLKENKITREEATLSQKVSLADDLCIEADSGGHTDQGVAYALMPAMIKLRDDMMGKFQYPQKIRVGAAGGIGTPEAAAAAFIMGADFIVTGSINQCTVEAGTSNAAKDLLQQINIQDTAYAPAGDMFELGARVQVLKKGLFFPARANKLYDLYRQYNSLEEIDEKTRVQIQEKYFKKSFEEIWKECEAFYRKNGPEELEKAKSNPKQKMALIFKWYFGLSTRLAMSGSEEQKVDYQIHCGPALGAFNQWVKGTALESWQNRHVDEIGEKLLKGTAELLSRRYRDLVRI